MTFRTIERKDLPASCSPFRVVDEAGHELEWINRFLDMLAVRGTARLTIRSCSYQLLHFVRWWSKQPGVDIGCLALETLTRDRACYSRCTGSTSEKICRTCPI